jgi:hypothetical protein
MAPARPRGPHESGGGDDGSPSAARPHRHAGGGGESVAAQQEAVLARIEAGKPGKEAPGIAGRGGPREESDVSLGAVQPEASAPSNFVSGVAGNPGSVAGRSAQDIADQFTAAGYPGT